MDAYSRPGVDVVLAGSSQMMFAGDPRIWRANFKLPWSVYNAGIWAASPVVTEHWLLQVVLPRLRPKSVILGVSPVDFAPADRSVPDRNYFHSPAVRSDLLGRIDRALSRHSVALKHRRDLRNASVLASSVHRRITGQPGPRLADPGLDFWGRLGRVDTLRTFDTGGYAQAVAEAVVRHGSTVSSPERAAFERTVRGLRARGVDVIVVQMPVAGRLIARYPRSTDYATFEQFLSRETAKLHVPLLDGATGLTDPRFFVDYDHVSRAGANVFNTMLARVLGPGAPGRLAAAVGGAPPPAPPIEYYAADALASGRVPPARASRPPVAPPATAPAPSVPTTAPPPPATVPSPLPTSPPTVPATTPTTPTTAVTQPPVPERLRP